MLQNFISKNLYQQNSNFINNKEICNTFMTVFAKKWLKKFPVHFNNLTSKEWKAVKSHYLRLNNDNFIAGNRR